MVSSVPLLFASIFSVFWFPSIGAFVGHNIGRRRVRVSTFSPPPRSLLACEHGNDDNINNNHNNSMDSKTTTTDTITSNLYSRRCALQQASAASSMLTAWSTITTMVHHPTETLAASLSTVETNNNNSKGISIKASWSATSGLNSADSQKQFVSFDPSAYAAMRDDKTRTPLFEKAISNRINDILLLNDDNRGGGNKDDIITVLDLGTGPFALFAIIAAKAGADRVYAIEADPLAAKSAKMCIAKAGYENVITVLEGFSTDIPQLDASDDTVKADFVVAEIVGSVASEEGAYASMRDARKYLKHPTSSSSYIPSRIQTLAAPASYTLHNLFTPPAFDWTKLDGEPVRFNCRDEGLQLLSDGKLVEDISFASMDADAATASDTRFIKQQQQTLQFTVDETRVTENANRFYDELIKNRMTKEEAQTLAQSCATSVSGIALWPRLILSEKDTIIVVDSRRYPDGGHQKSHWQTVLPIMSELPVGPLNGREVIQVTTNFQLPLQVNVPAMYRLDGTVYVSSSEETS